jgi:hypothetical protein
MHHKQVVSEDRNSLLFFMLIKGQKKVAGPLTDSDQIEIYKVMLVKIFSPSTTSFRNCRPSGSFIPFVRK